MIIEKIIKSPLKKKRFRVILSNTAHFDFGLEGATTYIDGATEQTRQNYWKRHLGNKTEEMLINKFIPSPALFSAYLLWGDSRSIKENLYTLNNELKKIGNY